LFAGVGSTAYMGNTESSAIAADSWSWTGSWTGAMRDGSGGMGSITELSQTGNNVTGTAYYWEPNSGGQNGELKKGETTLYISGTVSGDTLTGTFRFKDAPENESITFKLTMSTSGDFARGYCGHDNVMSYLERVRPYYGNGEYVPSDKSLKDGTLFTGPTGKAGKFSWEGVWQVPEADGFVWNLVIHQSGNWVTGSAAGYKDKFFRAYAYGNTLIGTMHYGSYSGVDICDIKLTMGSNGISAQGKQWHIGDIKGRLERTIKFTKLNEPGKDKPKSTKWSATKGTHSFSGSWKVDKIWMPDDKHIPVKMKLKQANNLSVNGTINNDNNSFVKGKVVGRNLYAEYKYGSFYGHFWARMSANKKALETWCGMNGAAGYGSTGKRIGGKKLTLTMTNPKKGKITKKTKSITIKVTKGAKVTLSAVKLKAKTKIKNVTMKKTKHTFKKLNFKKVKKGTWVTITAKKAGYQKKAIKFQKK